MHKNTHPLFITATGLIAVIFFCGFSAEKQIIKSDSLRLEKTVNFLCSFKKPRNFKNLSSLNRAADHIKQQLDSLGYAPFFQEFTYDTVIYKNIVCRYGNDSLPRIVLGAHYDVCGEQPGADDNASGVAGLLELARLFRHESPKLKYCVEMVFYTLEEPPFFRTEYMGSYIHAKSLADSRTSVKYMASLEMIGYFSAEKKSQKYPIGLLKLFYPSRGNYIALVGKPGMKKPVKHFKRKIKNSGMPAKKLIAPAKLAGVDFSDHLNYWKFGIAAFMITDTAFMRNFNYHEETDTPETLDFATMARVVDGIYEAVIQYR